MRICKNDLDLSGISSEFPEAKFGFYKSTPDSYISCFTCAVADEATLLKIWSGVVSVIAAEYQAKLKSKFEMWNIYLAFIVTAPICKNLEYEIENDKFSMRKIVSVSADGDDVEIFLNDEILGADLTSKLASAESVPDSNIVESHLRGKILTLVDSEGVMPTDIDILDLAEWAASNEI
ncbi:ABC-three component system middle component 1 [Pseudomonas sp. LT1P18]|uniref:ABC-three component system middle component 1 n=1 Tax=Pseudomonas arabinosi TaxID=3398357 RepID=UPI0039EF3DAF